jgi:hypothetical protein
MLTVPGVPIYGIAENGDLYWYHHRGFKTGKADWSSRGQGVKVGSGWHEGRFVFKGSPRGDDGIIYRVDGFNNLVWYRHVGHRGDALQAWKGGTKVGEGWHNARLVFSGGPGIIYMVNRQGELLWYRHEGYRDGTGRWARTAKVGSGWEIARTAFSDGRGIVYLVTRHGDLYWYRHHGYQDGSSSWADRKLVGNGWNIAPDIFSGGAGLVYTVRRDGGMYWYKHTGSASGEATWEASTGRRIGTGWGSFLRIF